MNVKLNYLTFKTNQIGKRYYYYRRQGRSIALRDGSGKPICVASGREFLQAYSRAEAEWNHRAPQTPALPGTMAALILDYQQSKNFQLLRDKTKQTYQQELNKILTWWGNEQVSDVTPQAIAALQDGLGQTPRQADLYVVRLRALFDVAIRQGLITINPAGGIKPQHKSTAIRTWKEDNLLHLMANARKDVGRGVLWLYRTGLRVSDCLDITTQQISDGSLTIIESKTQTPLKIPLHSDLIEDINRNPVSLRHVLTNSRGRKWTVSGFRNSMKKDASDLGIAWTPIHGIRRLSIVSLIEAGCSTAETAAVTGQSFQMVEHYAADRNRAMLAERAMDKLEREG